MEILSIPFGGSAIDTGLEFSGLLRLEQQQFVVEIQIQTIESSLGLGAKKTKKISINFSAVAELSLNKNIFGQSLRLRLHSLETVTDLPNLRQSTIRMPFKKRYLSLAQQIISDFEMRQAERRLDSFNED